MTKVAGSSARADAPAPVLIASTMIYPEVVEHPHSAKVLAMWTEAAAVMLAYDEEGRKPTASG